jgi:hypothetical protein
MPSDSAKIVRVQTDWKGWRTADIRLSDLQEIHWSQPSGAPRRLVHGYVSCANIAAGVLPHECDGGRPHRLKVCVIKSHTCAAVYAELEQYANARDMTEQRAAWQVPQGGRTTRPSDVRR